MNTYPMDTQIFNLKLSVLANSAYILACSLTGDQGPPTKNDLLALWNAEEDLLNTALGELLAFRVLELIKGTPDRYQPNPASMWQLPTGPDNF